MLIKQNTAVSHIVFFMVSSTDHVTGKTGLTPTVTISKNAGAFAAPSGAVTEIANGWYKLAANATDSNALGIVALHATGAGADPTDMIAGEVVAFDPQDANFAANTLLDLAAGVETGLTVRQCLRLAASVLFGKASGLDTTTAVYRNAGDTKNRVTATVDANGNRSAVTTDAT